MNSKVLCARWRELAEAITAYEMLFNATNTFLWIYIRLGPEISAVEGKPQTQLQGENLFFLIRKTFELLSGERGKWTQPIDFKILTSAVWTTCNVPQEIIAFNRAKHSAPGLFLSQVCDNGCTPYEFLCGSIGPCCYHFQKESNKVVYFEVGPKKLFGAPGVGKRK